MQPGANSAVNHVTKLQCAAIDKVWTGHGQMPIIVSVVLEQ